MLRSWSQKLKRLLMFNLMVLFNACDFFIFIWWLYSMFWDQNQCLWFLENASANRKQKIRYDKSCCLVLKHCCILSWYVSLHVAKKKRRFSLHLIVSRISFGCIARGSCHKMLTMFPFSLLDLWFFYRLFPRDRLISHFQDGKKWHFMALEQQQQW